MSLEQPVIGERARTIGGHILARLETLTYDERMAIIGKAFDELCTAELMSHEDGIEALRIRLHGINIGKGCRELAEELEQTGTVKPLARRS